MCRKTLSAQFFVRIGLDCAFINLCAGRSISAQILGASPNFRGHRPTKNLRVGQGKGSRENASVLPQSHFRSRPSANGNDWGSHLARIRPSGFRPPRAGRLVGGLPRFPGALSRLGNPFFQQSHMRLENTLLAHRDMRCFRLTVQVNQRRQPMASTVLSCAVRPPGQKGLPKRESAPGKP